MAYLVIGRLSLDEKGRLLLAAWPSEKRWEENKPIPYSFEVLLETDFLDFSVSKTNPNQYRR